MKLKTAIFSVFLLIMIPNVIWAATLYVVVSDNLRGENFSGDRVKRILLGEISIINNQRLILIYPSYSSPDIQILSSFVGKGGSVRNLKSYWSKMIFTGKATPPLTANNDGELRQMLGQGNVIGVAMNSAGMNVVYTING